MARENELAILLSNNWFFHDEKEYRKIETNSTKLLTVLGYSINSSQKAAKLIKQMYEETDKLEQFDDKTHTKLILLCDEVDRILGRKFNAKEEIKWWKVFRDKNYLLGAFFLFTDQLSKLGFKNLFSALKTAKELYHAGIEHKKKNWKLVRQHTKNYWLIINSTKVQKFIEF